MNSVAHVEINVSDLSRSVQFYSGFLKQLKWKEFALKDPTVTGFDAPDGTKLFLVQTEKRFISASFHRKHTGLNHLAFRVESLDVVNKITHYLKETGTPILYGDGPKDYSSEYSQENYFAVFFEDPDRIKLEVVYYK